MGLPRETLLGILAQLPESNLIKALDAAGVNIDGAQNDDGYMDGMGDAQQDDGLSSWNARQVKVAPSPRPPIFDKASIMDMPQAQGAPPERRPYQGPQEAPPANIAPFAANAG